MNREDAFKERMGDLEDLIKMSFQAGALMAGVALTKDAPGSEGVMEDLKYMAEVGAGPFWSDKILPAILKAKETKNGGAVCTGSAVTQGR